ncbi:hypothetical protein [Bdellovibrio bacteriovorus]|uniref:hypothetical protein n=1 Tax=Bdellovibrio bacteriovorus TaxID=959 RepID=UPI003AA7BA75
MPGELTTQLKAREELDFKTAFKIVMNIHEQCGDHMSWNNCREMVQEDVKRYESFADWESRRHHRTDRSQDQQWMLEEMDASIEAVFALMGKI